MIMTKSLPCWGFHGPHITIMTDSSLYLILKWSNTCQSSDAMSLAFVFLIWINADQRKRLEFEVSSLGETKTHHTRTTTPHSRPKFVVSRDQWCFNTFIF